METEQEIIIKSGESSVIDVNIGTETALISYILFVNLDQSYKLTIYKWSKITSNYYPIYLHSNQTDAFIECIPDKCIFFNKFILSGDRFKFKLNKETTNDAKIILFKQKYV